MLIRDEEWAASGWGRLLPVPAEGLRRLVGSAGHHEIDGDLDELAGVIEPVGWFQRWTGGFDAGLAWATNEYDRPLPMTSADRRREICLEALALGGHPVPRTVRELADTMVSLGLLTVSSGGLRWRTPEFLPRPDEVLPLPADWLAEDEKVRWFVAICPAVYAIREKMDRKRKPDRWKTTINQLAKAVEEDPETVRHALAYLCKDEIRTPLEKELQIGVTGYDGPFDADPERLPASKAIYLRVLPSRAVREALADLERTFQKQKKES